MKSQKSIAKKAQKARARRKDFVRRKNLNKHQVRLFVHEEKVERYAQKKRDGDPVFETSKNAKGQKVLVPKMAHVGYKIEKTKVRVYKHHEKGKPWVPKRDSKNRIIGTIPYPKSKKVIKNVSK